MSETIQSYLAQGNWKNKISNHKQLGGIETAVLNDGPANGTRVAWVDTGSGLRFKVVLDRAMDIADASYGACNLAWLSHLGTTPPNPAANSGVTWLNSFGGGLLTTCGLTHVGGPEEDKHGKRGLHDRISNTPATIETIQQPDPSSDKPEMKISGKILQSSVFGPHLELNRTVSARLGEPVIRIQDEVTNVGNVPAPHMILYHFNFGWPLVDEGAVLQWEGDWEAPDKQSARIFNSDADFKRCCSPLPDHRGDGEAVAFIDITPDSEDICRCGIVNASIDLKLTMEFSKSQLPWLINWQHWGKKEYVTALEPATNPPVGQASARKNNTLTLLEAGETQRYDIQLTVDGNL